MPVDMLTGRDAGAFLQPVSRNWIHIPQVVYEPDSDHLVAFWPFGLATRSLFISSLEFFLILTLNPNLNLNHAQHGYRNSLKRQIRCWWVSRDERFRTPSILSNHEQPKLSLASISTCIVINHRADLIPRFTISQFMAPFAISSVLRGST